MSGINNLANFSSGTALDVTGGAAGAGGVLSSFAGLASFSNPLSAGLSVLSALGGGTKIDITKAGAQGMSSSGLGVFAGENDISSKKPIVDFGEPVQVATLAALVILAIYGIKRLN